MFANIFLQNTFPGNRNINVITARTLTKWGAKVFSSIKCSREVFSSTVSGASQRETSEKQSSQGEMFQTAFSPSQTLSQRAPQK